ncbi:MULTISPECIES: alpha/beta fold hydrolase [Nostocales]|nr:alpha/beta hydrolase [Tolypothrix bouteillei VB521301]
MPSSQTRAQNANSQPSKLNSISASQARVIRKDLFVTSALGIRIFVREVGFNNNSANAGTPILLIHGGGGGGLATFDVNVPGYSLAEKFAKAGHRVYVMNVRGWERSTRPPALNAPPKANPPAVTSEEAVQDINAVVDWIIARNQARSVALVGWATGGHWAGMYTSRNNDKVSHLVLLNSLYAVNAPWEYRKNFENSDRPGEFERDAGAYRLVTADGLIANWTESIPMADKSLWRVPAVAQAYQQITLASDPTSGMRQPPSARIPGGYRLESYNLSRGQKYWNASDIRVPTLLIRGEQDHWSRPEDITTLKAELVNAPSVKTVVIPNSGHFLLLDRPERGRDRFIAETISFLK